MREIFASPKEETGGRMQQEEKTGERKKRIGRFEIDDL